MTLRDARIGDTVTVKKITGTGAVKRRIMDMGITRHTEIYVRKVAPLGDPIELTVRGYELSIRKADAEMVEIEDPVDETERLLDERLSGDGPAVEGE